MSTPLTIDDVIVMIKTEGVLGANGLWTCSTTLTPEMAQACLDSNDINRNIRDTRVEMMVNQMEAGRWEANGSTMSITDTKKMSDGQHRCTACVLSGVSVPIVMVYGVKERIETLSTIDQGDGRKVHDIIQIAGMDAPDGKVIAVSNILCEITDGVDISVSDRPAKAEFAMKHAQEIHPWISWAYSLSKQSAPVMVGKRRISGVRSVGATALATLALHLYREGADSDVIQEFYQGVIDPWSLSGATMREMTENRRILLEAVHRRTRQVPLNRSTGGRSIKPLMTEFAIHVTSYNRYVLNEKVHMIRPGKDSYRYLSDLPPVVTGPKRGMALDLTPAVGQ